MVMLAEAKQAAQPSHAVGLEEHNTAAQAARDECSVDFDRTMIVYSDHMDHDDAQLSRLSPVTSLMLGHCLCSQEDELDCTGETTIGCYLGDRFVGSLNFYSNPERHPQSRVDSEGLIHLWFPLPCFTHILAILRHEKRLSLSLISTDLNGLPFTPPRGALLTWPEPTGEEASADC